MQIYSVLKKAEVKWGANTKILGFFRIKLGANISLFKKKIEGKLGTNRRLPLNRRSIFGMKNGGPHPNEYVLESATPTDDNPRFKTKLVDDSHGEFELVEAIY